MKALFKYQIKERFHFRIDETYRNEVKLPLI